MRTKRRIALLLASAAALGVGLIAFPGSAAAVPPVVPSCTPPTGNGGSKSCSTLRTTAIAAPIGAALEPIRLGIRTRSQFSGANQESTSVNLKFDEQIAFNLTNSIPACPASELLSKTVAAAWEQCGPGADGNPANEGNAYMSTGLGNNVSGIASTVPDPGGAVACTMIFKGVDNNHVTIFSRAPVVDATSCNNPATQTGGSTTILFTGSLTHQPATSIYDFTLNVVNTQTANPGLDDLYATIVRGAGAASVVKARCATRSPSAHRMLETWDYFINSPADPNDTFTSLHTCPH